MTNNKNPKRYFVCDAETDGVSVVEYEYFQDLNRQEALGIAFLTLVELNRTLTDDAIEGDDAYIGNMKVTTGLLRSLDELDNLFPALLKELRATQRCGIAMC